jgi:phi13 family phage major tail protein
MDKKNKITYGLKNVHYAKILSENVDGVEYSTPVRMPGAAQISLTKSLERTPIAADDDPEYAVIYDNKGYDGDIQLYDVPDSFLIDCLGMSMDGDTIVENTDDRATPFALLFEFNGDAKKRRYVMYRCMGENPDVESQTKGGGSNANTVSLKLTSSPAKDTGDIKRTANESDGEVYTGWFDSVYTGTV